MKKFCCGDVVPGWSLSSESSKESTLLETFQSHAFRDHNLGNSQATLAEELRSNMPETNAA